MDGLDPYRPSRDEMLKRLLAAFEPLHMTRQERRLLAATFTTQFQVHSAVTPRASGESYVYHPWRVAIRSALHERWLGVKDMLVGNLSLSHDFVEGTYELYGIAHGSITELACLHGTEFVHHTMTLTKHKWVNQSNEEYFTVLLLTKCWQLLMAKGEDRLDNVITLSHMEVSKQWKKIAETSRWFPAIFNRMQTLIDEEVSLGKLDARWSAMPKMLSSILFTRMEQEVRRLRGSTALH